MRAVTLLIIIVFATLTFSQDKAADFTLKSTKGEEISLSQYAGKVVLLEWFTSWCKKCRTAFPVMKPYFNDLAKNYTEKGLTVLAINMDKKATEQVATFVEKKGIEYTVLHDPEGKVTGKPYKIKTLPVIMLVDKEGNIAKSFIGFNKKKKELVQKAIDELLAQ